MPCVNFRPRNTAGFELETNGLLIAGLATGPAYDCIERETRGKDLRLETPGWIFGFQGAGLAGTQTVFAKRAAPPAEIDFRETAASHHDDLRLTGVDTIPASVTPVDEKPLLDRPGRTHRTAIP